jgi:hypothetical protein
MKLFDRSCFGAFTFCLALTVAASVPMRADVVLAWNETLTQFLATHGGQLPVHSQARTYAILHLAIEQAISAAQKPGRPIGAPDDEQHTAANSAARDVLVRILPAGAASFEAFATAQLRLLGRDAGAHARAIALGQSAAALVLQKRETDKWFDWDPRRAAIAALSDPLASNFAATNREPKSPWLAATPFMLKTAAQFQCEAPYWNDMAGRPQPNAGLARARLFDSVDRATPRDTLVQFWSESPVVAWNRVACAVVDRAGLELAARARVLALVNLAIADATLSSLHSRFLLNAWKSHRTEGWVPVTGTPLATDVVAHLDGGEQMAFVRSETRQILTPPVPNFPSIMATVAGAAAAALSSVSPIKPQTLELPGPAMGNLNAAGSFGRSYASVGAAAVECAYASSLDGRHSREACVAGYKLGESIGSYIAKQTRAQRR